MEQDKIKTLTQEQLRVKVELEKWINSKKKSYKCLTGKAGTGKTYLLSCLALPKDTLFIAPTHQAVSVIANQTTYPCISYDSATFSRVVIKEDKAVFVSDRKLWKNAKPYSLIVVDEASMMSSKMVKTLTSIYKTSKILYVGDKGQLPAIEKDDYSVFSEYDCYELTENMRSGEDNPLLKLANKNYLTNNITLPTTSNCNSKGYKIIKYKEVHELFKKGDIDTICVATNKIRNGINQDIHDYLYPDTTYGIGEKLIANMNIGYTPDNKRKYDIINSSIVTVLDYKQVVGRVTVAELPTLFVDLMWDEVLVDARKKPVLILNSMYDKIYAEFLKSLYRVCKANTLSWETYHYYKDYFSDLSYAYAITTHKSQGSTYDNIGIACADITNFFDKKVRTALFYTAVTRAKHICYLIK